MHHSIVFSILLLINIVFKVFVLSNQRSLNDVDEFYLYPKLGLFPSFLKLPFAAASMYNFLAFSGIFHCLMICYDYQTVASSFTNIPNNDYRSPHHKSNIHYSVLCFLFVERYVQDEVAQCRHISTPYILLSHIE